MRKGLLGAFKKAKDEGCEYLPCVNLQRRYET
jgi:hypothetical protein